MKLNYFVIPSVVIAVSILGSLFTSQGLGTWYQSLVLPDWTPSGEIIGLVWSVIFIMVAVSALIFWNMVPKSTTFRLIVLAFILNAFLNLSWSYLFFTENLVFAAFITAVLLGLSTLVLVYLLWPISRTASLLLVPYALWVFFASFLNFTIWQLNFI